MATTALVRESGAQAALQRQGTLVLEEIGRQVRGAVEREPSQRQLQRHSRIGAGEDSGRNVMCYYARADGALCEVHGTTVAICSRAASRPSTLLRQPPFPTRDAHPVPTGNPSRARDLCFTMARCRVPSGAATRVDLAFAIRDRRRRPRWRQCHGVQHQPDVQRAELLMARPRRLPACEGRAPRPAGNGLSHGSHDRDGHDAARRRALRDEHDRGWPGAERCPGHPGASTVRRPRPRASTRSTVTPVTRM